MSGRDDAFPDWDDSEFDEDEPDQDDENNTDTCPHCGREIYDDCERCPHCENYLTNSAGRSSRRPWWLIIGVTLCLYVILRWIVG